MNDSERRFDYRVGRRSFIKGTGRYVAGGAVALGLAVLGVELSDGQLLRTRILIFLMTKSPLNSYTKGSKKLRVAAG